MGSELFTEEKMRNEIKFTLHNSDIFYPTGYFVLERQSKNGFLPCTKVLSNGNTQLVYDISGFQSLQELLPEMSPLAFRSVAANLIKQITVIRDIGFMECEYISMDLDHIFVDINNRSVALLYLPVTAAQTVDRLPLFRKKLVQLLHETARRYPNVSDADTERFLQGLGEFSPAAQQMQAILRSTGGLMGDILISKPAFLLGRSAAKADGVIPGSNMVGREHCKIIQQDGQYYLVDLSSVNGTMLNQNRLAPNQVYPLKPGDSIAMANMEFTFLIRPAGA